MSIEGKVITISGASSGIGEATARLLADKGAHVVLGARRTDRLDAIVKEIAAAGGSARSRALDVTSRADMEAFVAFAEREFGQVDVVVNNAGVMPLSPMAAGKVEEWDRMLDVNVRGVLYGIAAGLPRFKRQGFGHFVNVSSIGGLYVVPTAAVYCATKFAVRAISDGLRQENDDVRVTVISPGVTTSELGSDITEPSARAMMDDYRKIALGADAIARAIAFAIQQPADVDVNEIVVRPTASPN